MIVVRRRKAIWDLVKEIVYLFVYHRIHGRGGILMGMWDQRGEVGFKGWGGRQGDRGIQERGWNPWERRDSRDSREKVTFRRPRNENLIKSVKLRKL